MSWKQVAEASAIPPGGLLEHREGDRIYVVCNVEGEFHVLEGLCPHVAGPLAHGNLDGTSVVCPWHAWAFDCRTGVCDISPQLALERFEVHVENGIVYANLNDA